MSQSSPKEASNSKERPPSSVEADAAAEKDRTDQRVQHDSEAHVGFEFRIGSAIEDGPVLEFPGPACIGSLDAFSWSNGILLTVLIDYYFHIIVTAGRAL